MYGRLAIFALIALGACSTPYQEIGLTGGVSAFPMTANTFRIEARGNGSTGATTIQDYTMLKAAETAKAAGGTHFLIISAQDASTSGAIVMPGQAQTSVYGNTAYTSYSPPTTIRINKPRLNTYIRVLTIAPGQPIPLGAISADEIIQNIGPRVKRS